MDKATQGTVEHFFGNNDNELVVEELSERNQDDFAKYLLETDRVRVSKSSNRNMMVSFNHTTGRKTRREKKAEEEARESLEDEDTYFLVKDDERRRPVVGHAMNIEEGRATEMRIEIFDEDYRGVRTRDGKSLYDLLTALRIDAAEGTPYVCNVSPKAQYKMENLEMNDAGFEILKWAPVFKTESDPGVLMAYADGSRSDDPETLYVPDTEGDLEGMVEETLENFYEDPDTEIDNSFAYDDFDKFEGLSLERAESAIGKSCFRVGGGGSYTLDEVQDEIERSVDMDNEVEVRIDAEEPLALGLSKKLESGRWLPTGYVPDIGGEYDRHEISYVLSNDPYEYSVTEGVVDHLDRMGIPYRKENSEDSLVHMKSMPVEVGTLPRDISPDRKFFYSDF